MNLILLFPDDLDANGRARLTGRRLKHVREVHRASPGDILTVGIVNGNMGQGRVVELSEHLLAMEVTLDRKPPAPLPVTIILALPRPKVMRRVLFSLAVLGVKKIFLINSLRVEKSYWQTPFLNDEEIERQLVLGLEQAKDTVLPEVLLRKRFKPFVEDELPSLIKGTRALLAHPSAGRPCLRDVEGPITLAVGPEGGFIPYEIDKFLNAGFFPGHLGERILNIENAVPTLVARLVHGDG